jgi:hypothetical protein
VEEFAMSDSRIQGLAPGNKPPRKPKRSARKSGQSEDVAPRTAGEKSAPVEAVSLSPVDRDSMIAMAAYFRAERRNFEAGHELEDWLAAEAEVDAALIQGLQS